MRRHDLTQKKSWQGQIQRQRQWQRQIHLENTFKERSSRLVTFETYDQSDYETWPDQQKGSWQRQIQRQRQWQRQIHLENTFKERSSRLVTFETYVIMIYDLTNQKTITQPMTKTNENTNTETMTETWQGVWNCLHFRQSRTWLQDNHCDLTIKSETGQHSQFLRCFLNWSPNSTIFVVKYKVFVSPPMARLLTYEHIPLNALLNVLITTIQSIGLIHLCLQFWRIFQGFLFH